MQFDIVAQGAISGIFLGGVLALIALGLTLIWGVMGVLNMAHANFVMVAMFVGYFLVTYLDVHPYILLPFLLLVFFLLGALTMRLLIKSTIGNHELGLLICLALMIFLESAMTTIMSQTTHLDQYAIDPKYWLPGIQLGGLRIDLASAIAFLGSIMMAFLLYWLIRKTETGRKIRACSEHPVVASLMGIDVGRVHLIAFGIGIACTAGAATLMLPIYTITPQIGHNFLLPMFAIVALGGLGNFIGTLIAAFIIGFAEGIAGVFIPGPLVPAVGLGILVVVLLIRPEGLFGERGL